MGSVEGQTIPIRVANNNCHDTEVGLIGSDIRVTVTVRSEYPWLGVGGPAGWSPPPPQQQPLDVQDILGPHFEHLIGVREFEGEKWLEAHQVYELSAETCTSKLRYRGDSFEQVPIDTMLDIPTGPFPAPPFSTCPDATTTIPVESGDFAALGDVASGFDVAMTTGDRATLEALADPSVASFEGWSSTGSSSPDQVTNVPSGNYVSAVPPGCGSLVALRTAGTTLSGPDGMVTYLLVAREDGWRVWGWLPGYGR